MRAKEAHRRRMATLGTMRFLAELPAPADRLNLRITVQQAELVLEALSSAYPTTELVEIYNDLRTLLERSRQ